MPTCFVHEGRVLDWKFIKFHDPCYKFYTGDILQGQVFRLSERNWSAVPLNVPKDKHLTVHGFNSRAAAAQYILDLNYKE